MRTAEQQDISTAARCANKVLAGRVSSMGSVLGPILPPPEEESLHGGHSGEEPG